MKKLSKKAFTLIEILGAITIVGILSVIAIVSVNRIIQRAKDEHYKTTEKNFTLAAQSYVQQNRNKLPKVIGQKQEIKLKELLENNYIDEVKNYNKKDCDSELSYVQVFKYSQTDYSYLAYLKCPGYDGKKIIQKDYESTVTITFSGTDVKDAKAKIEITDDKKLLSYSYIVYKNGKEVKNSGNEAVENYATGIKKTIKLDEYTPGKIKIVVTATNIYGVSVTKTESKEYKDTTDPICIIKEEDKKENPKPWINTGNRKITVECDDGKGVGCTRKTYSKTFKTDTDVGKITIEDEAGNKTKCEVSVNIDKTAPTIYDIKNSSNSNWTNQNVEISAKAKDNENGSGVKTTSYYYDTDSTKRADWNPGSVATSVTGTWSAERDNTVYLVAVDVAGNVSKVETAGKVRIDKTKPVISNVTNSSGSVWTNQNVVIGATVTDAGGSGVKTTSYYYDTDSTKRTDWDAGSSATSVTGTWSAERNNELYLISVDNAGNYSDYKSAGRVQIDKTKPKIDWITSKGPHENNSGMTVSSKCSDALSGVATETGSSFVSSPTSSSGTSKTHYCTDNAGNEASSSKTFYVKIKSQHTSCDYATCETAACGCKYIKYECSGPICNNGVLLVEGACIPSIFEKIGWGSDPSKYYCKDNDLPAEYFETYDEINFTPAECYCYGEFSEKYNIWGDIFNAGGCECKRYSIPTCCSNPIACSRYNNCQHEDCGNIECWHYS